MTRQEYKESIIKLVNETDDLEILILVSSFFERLKNKKSRL